MNASENTKDFFVKASFIAIIILVANFFCRYSINIFLARHLGAENYGEYAVITNGIRVLSLVILLGCDKSIMRYLPGYLKDSDVEHAYGFLRFLKIFLGVFYSVIFILGVAFCLVNLLLDESGNYLPDIHRLWQHYPGVFFIWAIPIASLWILLSKVLRIAGYPIATSVLSSIARPFLLGIFLVIAYMLHFPMHIFNALGLYFLSLIVITLVEYAFVLKVFRFPRPSLSQMQFRAWLVSSLNLLGMGFLIANLDTLALIIFRILSHYPKEVGILSAIITIVGTMWIGYSAVLIIVQNLLSVAIKSNDQVALQRIFTKSQRIIFSYALLIFLLIIIFGKSFLSFFGAEFSLGYPYLLIYAAGNFLAISVGLTLPILQYSAQNQILLKVSILVVGILVLTSVLLCPIWGILGSAIAIVFAQLALSISGAILCKRRFNLSFSMRYKKTV
ncbi:MAG: putative rane associated protein [Gammaproteobacteria bacterium]|jgi:O-antigen/teichoic acid export membrane protein|nr:putative rane associated protein [Gammaproteobacteria bacterium]